MHFRAAKKLQNESSLSDAIEYDRDGNELTYLDVAGQEEDVADLLYRKERARAARLAIRRVLQSRERKIIVLRYGLDGREPMTQRDVAAFLGISRSYVSRLEKSALQKVRRELERTRCFVEE